ncbi:hypothetical protein ASPZODRAFT_153458 [Penicilliopsis zonata CBS 506.65]|uniref:Molybdenum cofactor sulfurase n=1 Tax=Penicilliopsis zonata CBS 506.65 TaxID=1073090 RepID=A0A1L9SBI2_9EURO|nr:hypothetical protein ASPZODRAFT_153458 [Penicilliopsis zonata CBS 506.65]OJJ44521.1 hypothetical protein ASPZODRAFT_153458 [Penicilliopsis zonata CBS 506.65]
MMLEGPERDSITPGYCKGYSQDVDVIRAREYPLLNDITYLDHAGTTPYAKSLVEKFAQELTTNLFGNPHSMSASSQLSTRRIDDVRLRTLRFFNASPDEFDLVFVANTTAAVKLVAETLRDVDESSGFWYGYHVDSHTSLVGLRELAKAGSRCFLTDGEVDAWTAGSGSGDHHTRLFSYPAQSNMNGRRLPLRWCEALRRSNVLTLLDVASLVSTSPLDLSNASAAPDFTALSFYKIFGFPDLGALIVRKSTTAHLFQRRRYFGGGTVDMVLTAGSQWHAKKDSSIHDLLEDGTLPFHNIIALDFAMETHQRLYGSMSNVSAHTRFLAMWLHDRLSDLTHANGVKACEIYKSVDSDFMDTTTQGAIIAFNLRSSRNRWVGKSDVEKLAAVRNIQIRSGSLCNPGGTALSLGWSSSELRRNYSLGLRCGDEHDVMGGRPTGALRVSLGAMSNMKDVDTLVGFIEEFYVDSSTRPIIPITPLLNRGDSTDRSRFYVESLCVYPIKSCGAFRVPDGMRWEIKREGLACDREWCLIHQGTGMVLSQKKYPRMALIHPFLDLDRGVLRITTCGGMASSEQKKSIEVSLSREASNMVPTPLCQKSTKKSSIVCGDQVTVQTYVSPAVSAFFTDFLGVPCTLARFPPQSYAPRYAQSWREHITTTDTPYSNQAMPGAFPQDPLFPSATRVEKRNPLLLANESPILLISRSSVNRLNETIKATTTTTTTTTEHNSSRLGKTVAADVFRGNIVVAESLSHAGDTEQPYIEDLWSGVRLGAHGLHLDILGSCQRCQMVCVDQFSGVRRDEPFSTLAKTRKSDGKVLFGRHAALSSWEFHHDDDNETGSNLIVDSRTVMVGDIVVPSYLNDE